PEQGPRQRPDALGGFEEPRGRCGEGTRLRDEEGPQVEAVEARGAEIRLHAVEWVLARVEVEDELSLGEPTDSAEEFEAVAGVVNGAETGRRGDRTGRAVLVQVAGHRLRAAGQAPVGRRHHLLAEIDAEVAQSVREERLCEPGVAAGEVED